MGALWVRVQVYYGSDSVVSQRWHKIIDILTTLHFAVSETSPTRLAELRNRVAGSGHTDVNGNPKLTS